ncbi:hypothetical protein D9615_010457 [Tricholomella constricta]|uniref:Uncharacterized protein n=1 Tax=Tricholomella constricta TaxID=117010 RepID=A0A8H5GLK8_9AGAR|nr:hypothetical protein D9615_010457 [Tricholomella constricta]
MNDIGDAGAEPHEFYIGSEELSRDLLDFLSKSQRNADMPGRKGEIYLETSKADFGLFFCTRLRSLNLAVGGSRYQINRLRAVMEDLARLPVKRLSKERTPKADQ